MSLNQVYGKSSNQKKFLKNIYVSTSSIFSSEIFHNRIPVSLKSSVIEGWQGNEEESFTLFLPCVYDLIDNTKEEK